MIYKERTDKKLIELKTTIENFLPLSYATFCFYEGNIYVECSVTGKRFILKEGFIGVVERTYVLSDDIKIAPKGDFAFNDLDNYNLSLNGIIFNGMDEVEQFLKWFDKVA